MGKVNAHYERIDPRNGARNCVPEADSIVICIVVHSERIDPLNGVFSLRFGADPFIMRIYFAHVFGVTGQWLPGLPRPLRQFSRASFAAETVSPGRPPPPSDLESSILRCRYVSVDLC